MMEQEVAFPSIIDGGWRGVPQNCIHRILENTLLQDATKSSKIAVRLWEESITYEQLNERANIFARNLVHELRHSILKKWVLVDGSSLKSIIVGVLVPPGIAQIISLLGILKAGGTYMPLDDAIPKVQIRQRLEDAGCMIAITTSDSAAYLKNIAIHTANVNDLQDKSRLRKVEEGRKTLNLEDSEMVMHSEKSDRNLCCLLYTSGFTAEPKGVLLTHENVINGIWWHAEWFPSTDMEVCVHFVNLQSVAHLEEIWWPLLNGKELIVVPEHLRQDLAGLIEYLETNNVTQIFLIPPVLLQEIMMILTLSPTKRLPKLHAIGTGFEVINKDLVNAVLEYFDGRCTVVSLYGLTETAFVTIAYRFDTKLDLVDKMPTGKPCPNNKVYILDERMKSVLRGTVGEIYIGGSSVMLSYTDLTLSKNTLKENTIDKATMHIMKTGDFGKMSNGMIYFEGRMDNLVNVRSVSVTTSAIEGVLSNMAGIKRVAVIACVVTDQISFIAFYTCLPGYNISAERMTNYSKDNLETHIMLSVCPLDELPTKLPHGTIDYLQLRTLYEKEHKAVKDQIQQTGVACGNKLGELKCCVSKSLDMKMDEINLEDNFFDLGGDSISLTKSWSMLQQSGWTVKLSDMLEAKSLKHIVCKMQNAVDVEHSEPRNIFGKFSTVILHEQDDQDEARLMMIEGYRTKQFYNLWVAFRRCRPDKEREDKVNPSWKNSQSLNLSLAVRNMETGKYAAAALLTEFTFDYQLSESRNFDNSDNRGFYRAYSLDIELPFAKKVANLEGRTLTFGQLMTDPSLSDAEAAYLCNHLLKASIKIAKENGFARFHLRTMIPFLEGLMYEDGAVKENEIFLKHYEFMGTRPWVDMKELPDDVSVVCLAIHFEEGS